MGTTNSECSLEERVIKLWHIIGTMYSVGNLEMLFIKFVVSFSDNKINRQYKRASNTIFGIIWIQQTHKVVKESVSYICGRIMRQRTQTVVQKNVSYNLFIILMQQTQKSV